MDHKPYGWPKETTRLVVRNMNGMNEERGYRLYWQNTKDPDILCPALGLATSNPFRSEDSARAYGVRVFGEKPIRIRG